MMRATHIMLAAIALGVIGRWAHNKKAADVRLVVEAAFALLVIALLDQGRSQPMARGFAWLFFAAVMLGSNSPITGLSKSLNASKAGGIGAGGAAAAGSITGIGTAIGSAGKKAAGKLTK